jgi:hypothetical protein
MYRGVCKDNNAGAELKTRKLSKRRGKKIKREKHTTALV